MRSLWFWAMLISLSSLAQGDPHRFALEPLGPGQQFSNDRNSGVHPNIQPFVNFLDSTWFQSMDTLPSPQKKWQIIPTGTLGLGYSTGDSSKFIWNSSPGISFRSKPTPRLDIGANYHFIAAAQPTYLELFTDSLNILPGVGFATQDENAAIAHYYKGHIGYAAGNYFHFEIGRGRHFWGDGYRSLILSHNAAPYPYFRMDTKVWHLQFTNLIMQLTDRQPGASFDQTRKKYGALHTLSWNATKNINFSFYEMVVWQASDTLSDRGLEFNYMHPLLFLRPVEFAQGSADNVLLGFSTSVKSNTGQVVYAQVMLDEFLLEEVRRQDGWWANKYGGQIGIKSFNTFTEGLHFQAEVNVVRPFTYTHGSSLQSYGHENQGLAHPLGTNFREAVFMSRYERKDWSLLFAASVAEFGRDSGEDNYGGNLFRSYRNPFRRNQNVVAQGEHHVLWIQRLEFEKRLKHFNAFADVMYRTENIEGENFVDLNILIGLRLPMIRNYRDL